MNYGGTRGYKSSLKDLLKDRKKTRIKKVYNNKEPCDVTTLTRRHEYLVCL